MCPSAWGGGALDSLCHRGVAGNLGQVTGTRDLRNCKGGDGLAPVAVFPILDASGPCCPLPETSPCLWQADSAVGDPVSGGDWDTLGGSLKDGPA